MPWEEKDTMMLKHEFVLRAKQKNCSLKDLCKEFGISRQTGLKWRKRFEDEGFAGLADHSRRPRKSPNTTTEDVVCEIIRFKVLHKKWGPKKIQELYARDHPNGDVPSVSNVHRILDKAGLVRHPKRRKLSVSERIQNRVQAQAPNDLWTVDFKGWWYTQDGQKCDPLTVRDDYSKYILSIKSLSKGNTEEVQLEFERLFRIYGLPKVIRSDNGPPFASARGLLGLTRLSVWWLSLGIALDRITPGHPEENGSHERMHRDIKRELQGQIHGDLKKHQAYFDVWRNEFNSVRPHEALKMQTPESVYIKSDRKYYEDIGKIEYPIGYLSRQVTSRGCITLDEHRIFISYVLQGYNIGLKEIDDETMSVWFDNLPIGDIDLKVYAFKKVVQSNVKKG